MKPPSRRKRADDAELVAAFEAAFGHRFQRPELLARAVTHTSFAEESTVADGDNQRLEFLGDSVVGLAVTDRLFRDHGRSAEGVLSKLRSQLVSTDALAEAAVDAGLDAWLRLGRGEEKSAGRAKQKILADVFEAVAGALYRDAGFETARAWVEARLATALSGARPEQARAADHKSALQEMTQADGGARPEYVTVDVSGPAHAQTFEVEVQVAGRALARGAGGSKKKAQQAAAAAAIEALTQPGAGTMESSDSSQSRNAAGRARPPRS